MKTTRALVAAWIVASVSACNAILGNDAAVLYTDDAPLPAEPAPADPAPGAPQPNDPTPTAPVEPTAPAPAEPVVPPKDEDAGVLPVVPPDAASPCPAERKWCFGVCVLAAEVCVIPCEAHRADCNADPDDGCEAKLLEDNANCGACGVACAPGTSCKGAACKKVGPK